MRTPDEKHGISQTLRTFEIDSIKVLKSIKALLCDINSNTTAINTNTTPPIVGVSTISNISTSANGTIPAGKQSVTFAGISGTSMTVNGVEILPGEQRTWNAYLDSITGIYRKLPEIPYVATGGVLRIIIQD